MGRAPRYDDVFAAGTAWLDSIACGDGDDDYGYDWLFVMHPEPNAEDCEDEGGAAREVA